MALSSSTLDAELQNLPDTLSEATAITNLAAAFKTYMAGASANAVPISSLGLNAGESAMTTAMVGLSVSGQGALKLQQGIVAFWAALVAAPAVAFTAALVVTPPVGISTLAATLAPIFASNIATSASKPTACGNIATAIHAANSGGTVTFPPAVVAPVV